MRTRRRPAAPGRGPAPSPERPAAEQVEDLQRTAGNRAVAGLLQRDPAPLGFSPFAPNIHDLRGVRPAELAPDLQATVRAFVETRRVAIGERVGNGTISMPEVVQMVREGVEGAIGASPWAIEMVVVEVMGREVPPPTRRKRSAAGSESEISARIGNALGAAGRGLKVESRAGSLQLTMSGVVATTTVGGAKLTATGGPSGGELKAEGGGAEVTATASTSSLGLSAKLDRAQFEAKVEKDDASGRWSKWSASLRVAVVGDDPLDDTADIPELQEAAVKAEAALRGVVAHLQAGGSPTDPRVKELMKDVKPAVEGVKRAVQTPKGPNVTIAGTVKGGDDKLGTFAGVALIVEF